MLPRPDLPPPLCWDEPETIETGLGGGGALTACSTGGDGDSGRSSNPTCEVGLFRCPGLYGAGRLGGSPLPSPSFARRCSSANASFPAMGTGGSGGSRCSAAHCWVLLWRWPVVRRAVPPGCHRGRGAGVTRVAIWEKEGQRVATGTRRAVVKRCPCPRARGHEN